jgi:hypothetical protein
VSEKDDRTVGFQTEKEQKKFDKKNNFKKQLIGKLDTSTKVELTLVHFLNPTQPWVHPTADNSDHGLMPSREQYELVDRPKANNLSHPLGSGIPEGKQK